MPENATRLCAYCAEPIEDSLYQYVFFSESGKHLPVHNVHLEWAKGIKKGTPYKPMGGKK